MICANCQADMPTGANFCPACGHQAEVTPPPCQRCGAEVAADARFCVACGAAQPVSADVPLPMPVASPSVAEPVKVAPPPVAEPVPVAPPAIAGADLRPQETTSFWGPEPDYGKHPWAIIGLLIFLGAAALILWINGVFGALTLLIFPIIILLHQLYERYSLKPTKIYYTIAPAGLSYLSMTGSMDPIAWAEMDRLELRDGGTNRLKLFWRGFRPIASAPKWNDRVLTRLTGKQYKGGVPLEDNKTMERSITLDGTVLSPDKVAFGERFSAVFRTMVPDAA